MIQGFHDIAELAGMGEEAREMGVHPCLEHKPHGWGPGSLEPPQYTQHQALHRQTRESDCSGQIFPWQMVPSPPSGKDSCFRASAKKSGSRLWDEEVLLHVQPQACWFDFMATGEVCPSPEDKLRREGCGRAGQTLGLTFSLCRMRGLH